MVVTFPYDVLGAMWPYPEIYGRGTFRLVKFIAFFRVCKSSLGVGRGLSGPSGP